MVTQVAGLSYDRAFEKSILQISGGDAAKLP